MMKTLWERYFFFEVVKLTLQLLIGFFFLYIMIDYSTHSSAWSHSHASWSTMFGYYLLVYIKHIDLLLPFAILISTIKTLCTLNVNHELIALLASGIPLKRLLLPFLTFGLICTALIYVHFEYSSPTALFEVKKIEDLTFKAAKKRNVQSNVKTVQLPDGTQLIYQYYDSSEHYLFDVFWVKSFDHIVHMKKLSLKESIPTGLFVDVLKRDAKGVLIKSESMERRIFKEIALTPTLLTSVSYQTQELSISDLLSARANAETTTWFYKRLFMPWLCLLAVIAPAPFCLLFTRQLPTLFIYMIAIAGLISLQLLINAATIAAQDEVLPAWLALGMPFAACYAFFGRKFLRMQ